VSTSFPTSLDTLTTPSGSSTLGGSSPTHTGLHTNEGDAIEALQVKVGVDGSGVTTSLDYRVGVLELAGIVNVKAYGAAGDGAADDTAEIQAAIDSVAATGGVVYFPVGSYKLSAALTVYSNLTLIGDGATSVLIQTATNTHCLSGSAITRLVVRDLYILGTGSGTGDGIHLVKGANDSTPYTVIENVTIDDFGQDGVSIENPIVTTLTNVRSQSHGRYGYNLYGQVAGSAGTSCALTGCYGNACTTAGFRMYNVVYSALDGCAADHNGIGYLADTCQSVSLSGCGAEGNTTNGFKVTAGSGVNLTSPWVYDNRGVGIYLTGSTLACTVFGAVDNSPNGTATSFIKTDTGCTASLIRCTNITANSITGGTVSLSTDSALTLTKAGATDVQLDNFGGVAVVSAPFAILGAGFGLRVSEGSNAKMGLSTLVGGTVVVSNTSVTANSRIFLTCQVPGGTPGFLRVSARTASTSFTILSSSGTDTSQVAWLIVEPS
jgi:hypothetical protein